MLHAKKTRKFGREKDVRNALLRGLAISLIKHGKIQTTLAKAKELREFIEPMVTRAKKGDPMTAQRILSSRLINNVPEVKKLVKDIAPKYKDIPGGYTRIIKTGARLKDSAAMAVIEFV